MIAGRAWPRRSLAPHDADAGVPRLPVRPADAPARHRRRRAVAPRRSSTRCVLVNRLEQRYEEDRSRRVPLVVLLAAAARAVGGRERRARGCRSAPTASAATSSRASCTARGPRWASPPSRLPARSCWAWSIGGLAGYVGGRGRRGADAARGVHPRAAGDLRRARAAGRAAARPAGVGGLRADGRRSSRWSAGRSSRAACGTIVAAERQRDYADGRRVARRGPRAAALPAPAAGLRRLRRRRRRRCSCPRSSWPRRRCRSSASGSPIRCRAGARCSRTAANVTTIADFPWTLRPAAAIFVVVLALNLVVQGAGASPVVGAAASPRRVSPPVRRRQVGSDP